MNLLMLAGPGTSGKTEMLKAIDAMCAEHGITVAHHFSSTRETYARHGLENEKSALQNEEFNRKFQKEVLSDNVRNLVEKLAGCAMDAPSPDLFVTDRSPYDYTSYQMQVFAHHLTIEEIENYRSLGDTAMVAITAFVNNFCVLTLPWPMPWNKDTESSDGWRADKTGKNFLWSAVVESELIAAQRRLEVNHHFESKKMFFGRMGRVAEVGSPQDRARWALTQLFPSRMGA